MAAGSQVRLSQRVEKMRATTNLKSWLVASLILLGTGCPALADKIIYVDDDANGLNTGTSWSDAYRFLQDALVDANSAQKPVEIRVAAGVYKPDRLSAEPNGTGDRTATFRLINGVMIKGGYAGFGEADPNARDITKHETILSGDLAGNDVDVNDPCDLLKEPSRTENSYHVVNSSKTDRSAVLEGFTISGGNASVKPFDPMLGFEPNGVGGGMFNSGGAPSLINCSFICNSACERGGGFFSVSFRGRGGYPMLTGCTFVENYALVAQGGAICAIWSEGIELRGCVFKKNRAWAGGAMCGSVDRGATLIDCVFRDNFAEWAGGGMYNGVAVSGESTLVNCIFTRNLAEEGGGVYNHGSPTLLNCMFSGNSAVRGGGVYCYTGSARITNCIFTSNTAQNDGGGMYSDAYRSPTVANCTFAGNSAPNGNALACDSFMQHFPPSSPHISNCILWDGGSEIWNNDGSAVTVTYSDVQGGKVGIYDPCDGLVWGAGNIDVDPCFADANKQDFHLKSQGGRWDADEGRWTKDDVTSLCIDAGNPASTIGLEPFPNGGIINMGAYGGTAEASKSYFGKPVCETIVAGDINGDCKIDNQDLFFLSLNWLADNRQE